MGPSRETREQQQKFILELATRFQTITSLAIGANYGSDKIFEGPFDLRLATAIVNRNERFANDVSRWGHTINFDGVEELPSPAPELLRPPPVAPASLSPRVDDSETKRFLSPRRFTDEDCISELLSASAEIEEPSAKPILPWITHIYNTSRGFELGTFNASLLTLLWKKQSAHWDDLALGYISDVITIVNKYTLALLRGICGDERVLNGLISVMFEDLETRYRKAIDQVKFILYVERACTPLTANHYFAVNLEKR